MARVRNTKADPQAKTVDDWEAAFTWWAHGRFKQHEVRKAIVKACAMYRVPEPEAILFATKNRRNGKKLPSWASYWDSRILIRPRHCDIPTALHEAAHFIDDHLCDDARPSHGPVWLGIYIVLLDKFQVAPLTMTLPSAKSAHLNFLTPEKAVPNKIRSTLRKLKVRK